MIPLKKERQIRYFLKEGISHRKIARKTGIHRETVGVIAKLPALRKRKCLPAPLKKLNKPGKCKTCGGRIEFQECLLCFPREANYDNDQPVNGKDKIENFLNDVWELYKLNLIKHPLFISLARRAKYILIKEKGNNAKKT